MGVWRHHLSPSLTVEPRWRNKVCYDVTLCCRYSVVKSRRLTLWETSINHSSAQVDMTSSSSRLRPPSSYSSTSQVSILFSIQYEWAIITYLCGPPTRRPHYALHSVCSSISPRLASQEWWVPNYSNLLRRFHMKSVIMPFQGQVKRSNGKQGYTQ